MIDITLHLVLNYHWYLKTTKGSKRVEYREIKPYWTRLIWDRKERIKSVRFSKGYTSEMKSYKVDKIDIGECPIDGWNGNYYRIHFSE